MAHAIHILNGPNLNLLGRREPEIYGSVTLADIEVASRVHASKHGYDLVFRQSNHEGQLVDWLHEAGYPIDDSAEPVAGIVLNAGAYTHTSVALHDAVRAISLPVIEVHLSNTHAREPFRKTSYISPAAVGFVAGFGENSYILAIDAIAALQQERGDADGQ